MTGTIINESNSDLFLPAVPDEALVSSDIFVGVTDGETDTACGVLAAEAIGDHTIAIRFMWVAEEYRGRGAGTELVYTLMEAAEAMDASSVVCVHSRGNISDGVAETLTGCGFAIDDEQTSPIYAVSISELNTGHKTDQESKSTDTGLKIRRLSKVDDKQWQVGSVKWKENDGPLAGLRALSRRRSSYNQQLSFVALDDKEDIAGVLLGICDGNEYELQALSAMGNQAPRILLALIDHAIDVVARELGEEVRIIVSPVAPRSMELLEQLTGGAYYTIGETDMYTYEI